MIDLKPQLLFALQNDLELISSLGGITTVNGVVWNRIYQLRAPNATEFPRLIFWEMDNVGAVFADDIEADSQIYLQLDIYTKNQSTSGIAGNVDKVMTTLGFMRTASTDEYSDNNDTQIFEKHMRYSILTKCN